MTTIYTRQGGVLGIHKEDSSLPIELKKALWRNQIDQQKRLMGIGGRNAGNNLKSNTVED